MENSTSVSHIHNSTATCLVIDYLLAAFIDALFLCYSALTVTGLSTVNLSTLTAFQQAILFVLMGVGNVVRLNAQSILNATLIDCPYRR